MSDSVVYQDMPFDEYTTMPFLNISSLLWAAVSAEHLKAAIEGKLKTDSQAKAFGRAIHCRLLEPDRYKMEYRVATPCSAIVASGKNKGLRCGNESSLYWPAENVWLCGTHRKTDCVEPEDYVSESEAQKIEAIADKVKNHKVVRLFRQSGGFEASIVFRIGDIECKGRVDKLIIDKPHAPNTIIDIKKVRVGHGGREAFSRAILNYHYASKAAWYVDAAMRVHGLAEPPHFIWVAVEDDYPFSIGVYAATDETLAIGREEYQGWLETYRRCQETGEWPGYGVDIEPMGLPDWYIRRREFQEVVA